MKPANCLVVFLLFFPLPLCCQSRLPANPDSESILAARSQYSPADTDDPESDNNAARRPVAQFPRSRTFHPPMRSPRAVGYPGGYPSMYAGESNGRHVLIGALIGFGLGAALGAKANTDQHPGVGVKAAFLVGGVGALIGAAVGSGVPSVPFRYHHRGRSWPEEDWDSSRRQNRKGAQLASGGQSSREKDTVQTPSSSPAQEPEPARRASE